MIFSKNKGKKLIEWCLISINFIIIRLPNVTNNAIQHICPNVDEPQKELIHTTSCTLERVEYFNFKVGDRFPSNDIHPRDNQYKKFEFKIIYIIRFSRLIAHINCVFLYFFKYSIFIYTIVYLLYRSRGWPIISHVLIC
jgi:hypothetical protein